MKSCNICFVFFKDMYDTLSITYVLNLLSFINISQLSVSIVFTLATSAHNIFTPKHQHYERNHITGQKYKNMEL